MINEVVGKGIYQLRLYVLHHYNFKIHQHIKQCCLNSIFKISVYHHADVAVFIIQLTQGQRSLGLRCKVRRWSATVLQ